MAVFSSWVAVCSLKGRYQRQLAPLIKDHTGRLESLPWARRGQTCSAWALACLPAAFPKYPWHGGFQQGSSCCFSVYWGVAWSQQSRSRNTGDMSQISFTLCFRPYPLFGPMQSCSASYCLSFHSIQPSIIHAPPQTCSQLPSSPIPLSLLSLPSHK